MRPLSPSSSRSLNQFQFTHPGRGATSIVLSPWSPLASFQFTHPGRGATLYLTTEKTRAEFQFTHPGRGATIDCAIGDGLDTAVSIHAPREGCDASGARLLMSATVSIHAPREGCDTHGDYTRIIFRQFQFTHPGRGATHAGIFLHRLEDVSIHAPREGCDALIAELVNDVAVSIHAPREGCDLRIASAPARISSFQFTHPGRGATVPRRTHRIRQNCFNSRTPGGVRHFEAVNLEGCTLFQFTHPGRGATGAETPTNLEDLAFQFTHPGRGATPHKPHTSITHMFQFTHPGRGATINDMASRVLKRGFNSRTPGGVRHEAVEVYADYFCVSIHAPREGCDDDGACRTARGEDVSIHAPREGCDDFYLYPFCVSELVSIHAPREGCDCAIADMSEDAISFNSRTPGGVRQKLFMGFG